MVGGGKLGIALSFLIIYQAHILHGLTASKRSSGAPTAANTTTTPELSSSSSTVEPEDSSITTDPSGLSSSGYGSLSIPMSMSFFLPMSSMGFSAVPLLQPPLPGDTTVSFSVTVNGSTAFCQLSFSSDFVCISYAGVSCQVAGSGEDMGQVEHTWDFITKIDGMVYDMEATLTFNPSTDEIDTLVICSSSTCASSSSSLSGRDTCLDYPRLCGSSSSSSSSSQSSSSPNHSIFKYISSSYVSFYSSSSSSSHLHCCSSSSLTSSSSSSSSSSDNGGLILTFGSSPSDSSSSACSIADFGWSSGSEGVVFAWPSYPSSSFPEASQTDSTSTFSSSSTAQISTTVTTATQGTTTATQGTTTAFTTNGGVTCNSSIC